jgi:hypothetical protein
MSDDEAHNQTFEQVSIHLPPLPFSFRFIGRFLGRFRGLPHLPHAMLGTPQERSRRHQGYVVTSGVNGTGLLMSVVDVRPSLQDRGHVHL